MEKVEERERWKANVGLSHGGHWLNAAVAAVKRIFACFISFSWMPPAVLALPLEPLRPSSMIGVA